MSITPKGTRNYASSIFDGRTQYSKAISNRTFNMDEVISEMSNRKPPAYVVGDEITLADGTTRNVRFRRYSPSQSTYVYRLNTEQKNRYGGTLSTGNLTEAQVLEMDVSRKPSLKVSEQDGWIVQFKTTSESAEFRTWVNDGGEVAIFEKELAIQFAQGMVMAHDQLKQWAIFRIRPFEGYKGEQYFTTLIQPDGKYTAAIAHRALYDGGNWSLLDADDEILANYHHTDTGYCFLPFLAITWVDDSRESIEVQTYRNPCLPVFETGTILTLPTGFARPVQFITPYWVASGQVGFRYWFYVADKQLVNYIASELTLTDLDVLLDEAFGGRNAVFTVTQPPVLYIGGTIFVDENGDAIDAAVDGKAPIENFADSIRAEMRGQINELKRKNERLKDVLLDICNCAEKMSTDADDNWGWLSYMASCGLSGDYYNRDTMLPRFGIGEFPKHTLSITDEI